MKERQGIQYKSERAKHGNKADEEEFFADLRVRFSVIAQHRLRRDNVEDIVHDACIVVLEKYKNLPEDVVFEAWAYQVLRNTIGSHLRAAKVREVVQSVEQIDSVGHTHDYSASAQLKRVLENCLKKVALQNSNYLRILGLRNQGYTTDEICGTLGIKTANFYVMLHRCRKLLYDCVFRNGKKDE
jgi:RNA polymerase sigma-70 factor (ECF subfamily)